MESVESIHIGFSEEAFGYFLLEKISDWWTASDETE